jgi:hypothetical protein
MRIVTQFFSQRFSLVYWTTLGSVRKAALFGKLKQVVAVLYMAFMLSQDILHEFVTLFESVKYR